MLLACAPAGLSQSTVTTGQVLDPRGFQWQAGTGTFSIQCTGNAQPYVNGSPIPRTIPLVRLDGTGSFTQSLYDTSILTDTNNQPLTCQWRASFTDQCGIATFSVTFTGITGAGPVNVTSQISAVSVDLSPACTPPGTLDSITAGNLPPLFTTTITGTPTNPILNFVPDAVAANLVLAGPPGGVTSAIANTGGTSNLMSASAVSTSTVGNALYIGTVAFLSQPGSVPTPTTPPSGWTVIDQNSIDGIFVYPITATGTFTASIALTNSANWVSTLALTGSSGAVTRVQSVSMCSGSVGNTTCTGTFGTAVTAGNSILVVVASGEASGIPACSTTDTLFNSFPVIASNVGGSTGQLIFLATGITGGADTVSTTCATSGGGLFGGSITAYELTPIPAPTGSYSFRHLVGLDLPLPTVSSLGGVDSYTAPTHQFLTAINPDGSVSSKQPSTSDISGSFVTAVNGTANEITSSGGSTPTLSIPSTFVAPGTITATTSITDSGLTANRCVQTSTGGLLTVASTLCASGFSQAQFVTYCASGCIVTGTPCTTGGGANNTCNNTINWPSSFADAGYTVACQGIGNIEFPFIPYVTKLAGSVTVTTSNGQGSAAIASSFGEIDCSGFHP